MGMSDFVLRYDLVGAVVDAADVVDDVLIDLTDAPDWVTPIEDRPAAEIRAWWRRPYIITRENGFVVACLDGGAWDRPIEIGWPATISEAVKIARSYQPRIMGVHVRV